MVSLLKCIVDTLENYTFLFIILMVLSVDNNINNSSANTMRDP